MWADEPDLNTCFSILQFIFNQGLGFMDFPHERKAPKTVCRYSIKQSSMRKSDIGKLYSFKFLKRKDAILGIVLDFNEQWITVRRLYDYSLDGYIIFRNDKMEFSRGEYERFASKILKLKNYSHLKEPHIPIDSLGSLFSYIDKKHKLIQLDTKDGKAFDVVRYLGIDNNIYLFKELTTRAKWRYQLKLPEKEINYISFGNDYLNSLKLVTSL